MRRFWPVPVLGALSIAAVASMTQTPYVDSREQLVTEVHVRDIERSIDFYGELGFRLVRREEAFAELDWEGNLFFLDSAQKPPEVESPAANMRIMVADVDAFWEKTRAMKASVLKPIGDRYYGLRDFTIADPDGFGIRFASRLGE